MDLRDRPLTRPEPQHRTPAQQRPARTVALVALALVIATWFATLGARHLLPSDEGRYAEIAREMQATGDWVTIRYQGLKYFEKPPFQMWATALAYDLFGVGDWQARLWAALAGLAGILATMAAAWRWFGRRAAWTSGLVLLAAPAWNLGGHFNALDIGVSGALAWVLAGFLIAQHPATPAPRRRGWLLGAWFAMAIAVLTKGLIGIVLPGLVLAIYTLAARDWQLWRRLALLPGFALFLIVAAPWFVLVSLRNPEFPQFFFIHEHLQRYTSTVHHRSAPFWYFVPQLLVGFLPWIGLGWRGRALLRDDPRGGAAIEDDRRGRAERPDKRGPGAEAQDARRSAAARSAGPMPFRPRLLLAIWAVAIFVFFSLSGSKLPGYILPVYPALAILAALALQRIDVASWRRQLVWMTAVAALGLVASPVLGRFGSDTTPNASYRSYAFWAAAMFAVALAGLALAWRWRRTRIAPSIAAAALAWFFATTIGIVGHEAFGRNSSGVDLVPATLAAAAPGMPIYAVRLLDHTLPFYLRRTLIPVEEADELEFGIGQEPDKWLPTLAAFATRWKTGGPALAIMKPETFDRLRSEGLPMRVVVRSPRRVVVANTELPEPSR